MKHGNKNERIDINGTLNDTEIVSGGGTGNRQIELTCIGADITIMEDIDLLYGANYQFVYIEHPEITNKVFFTLS